MSDDGFNLADALDSPAVETIRTALGLTQEAYVCPECDAVCDRSETHNPQTAAFDGGVCPSWYCGECDTHYVREVSDESHTLDLYGRSNNE